MARPLYSSGLFYGHNVSNSPFPVPADQVWVVRTITAFYPGGTVGPGIQIIDTGTDATVWWDSDSISSTGAFRYWTDLRLTLDGPMNLVILGFGGPDITLSGYQFVRP